MSQGIPKKAYRRLSVVLGKLRQARAVFTQPNTVLLAVTTDDSNVFVERDGIKYARVDKSEQAAALAEATTEVESLLSQ